MVQMSLPRKLPLTPGDPLAAPVFLWQCVSGKAPLHEPTVVSLVCLLPTLPTLPPPPVTSLGKEIISYIFHLSIPRP